MHQSWTVVCMGLLHSAVELVLPALLLSDNRQNLLSCWDVISTDYISFLRIPLDPAHCSCMTHPGR